MITQTHPETIPAPVDDDLVHVVCCDPDMAMCGQPVPGDDWADGDPTDCKVCAIAEEENLPCGDPGCPRWSEW